jgi:hypothetical protein
LIYRVSVLLPKTGAFSIKRYSTELYEGLSQRLSVEAINIDCKKGSFIRRVCSNIKSILSKKIQVIIVPSHSYSYLLLFLNCRHSIVVVHDLHNLKAPDRGLLRKLWDYLNIKICARKANIVYVSQTTKTCSRKFFIARPKILTDVVIHNWLSPNLLTKLEKSSETRSRSVLSQRSENEMMTILSIGTTAWYKNNEFLVSALHSTNFSRRIKLIRVGPLRPHELSQLSLILKEHEFEYHIALTDRQLIDVYKRATILVNTSGSEGFCLPILESLCLGTRVLCPKLNVFEELYGDTVVYYVERSKNDFASKLGYCLNQPSSSAMQVAKNLRQKYSFDLSMDHFVHLISTLPK